MLKVKFWESPNSLSLAFEFTKVLFFVYCFLISIDLMGSAFKASGEGFAESIMQTTSNPFLGLIIGIVVTSVIQSSSTTTSIIVVMVGSGTISLQYDDITAIRYSHDYGRKHRNYGYLHYCLIRLSGA